MGERVPKHLSPAAAMVFSAVRERISDALADEQFELYVHADGHGNGLFATQRRRRGRFGIRRWRIFGWWIRWRRRRRVLKSARKRAIHPILLLTRTNFFDVLDDALVSAAIRAFNVIHSDHVAD